MKRAKPPKMGLRETPQVRSAGHLKWVRGFVCSAFGRAGHECTGKTEAHHVRGGGDGGMGLKPGDDTAIPLCAGAHSDLHTGGEISFAVKHGLDLQAIAAKFWRLSPHRPKHEAKQ